MQTKTAEVKDRFAEAKERLAKSEVRLAYMDPEDMLFLHKDVKENLASIEARLKKEKGPLLGISDEYASMSAVLTVEVQMAEAEVQLAKAEVQLAKAEKGLLLEMIEHLPESKMTTRFIEEETVRLAEAEVRLLEAELRLLKTHYCAKSLYDDGTIDPVPEISLWLYHAETYSAETTDLYDGFEQEYAEKILIETSARAAARAHSRVEYAEERVQIAETEVLLAEARLRLEYANLRLAKTFSADDYL